MSNGNAGKQPTRSTFWRVEADRMLEPDLLVTKFTIPPVRSMLLHRSHLLEVLEQSRSVPLTLLSAGAGFGKTTLLSAWARESAGKVAWLSLDDQDNDPLRFWTYLGTALQRLAPHVGATLLQGLQAPQPPLEALLATLLNELLSLRELVTLVLEDYHVIQTSSIHQSLAFLLEHLPPHVHLVIASRS